MAKEKYTPQDLDARLKVYHWYYARCSSICNRWSNPLWPYICYTANWCSGRE